jgi:trigger factor
VAGVSVALSTTVTELPESRVRVQVQVPPAEVQRRLERKARQLGREMKLPGFRRGKIPAPLVIQRVGREAVLEEAVRDTLGDWYADAIDAAGISPVGDPKLDLADLPAEGAALQFSIEIGVLPSAELGQYKGLEVGRREVEVPDDAVQEEVERLRERLARLETVERAAGSGDFVVADYVGRIDGEPFQGGEGRDQLVELGAGNLIPGFEEGLDGVAAGQTRTIDVTFPADYPTEQLAGAQASFEIAVKEVKQKLLPELDEDFAVDVGFDTIKELREDVRTRLAEAEERRVQAEFREAALDAAVAAATVQTPDALVQAKSQELWERMLHSLSHRGISREAYLRITGREEAEMVAELESEARQSLRREAVIAAVVQAESIEPSEQELLDALQPSAEREGVEPAALLARLRESGRVQTLIEDVAARDAVELIAAQAEPIPLERAHAREKLWTPESQRREDADTAAEAGEQAPAELWTPDR